MATARIQNTQALASSTWTLIFDSSTDGDVKQVIVLNLASSANSIEVLATPCDREATGAPGGGAVGFPIAPGESTSCTAVKGVTQVWVRSAGANVAWKVGIR